MRYEEDMTATCGHVDKKAYQKESETDKPANKGRMLLYARVCHQDIAYPTDLGLLNTSRKKCE